MYKTNIYQLFKKNYVHRIFGTAGSGKTTFLLDQLNQLFEQGVNPNKIAFVSFTNKAVDEIVERCIQKFKQFSPQQFTHFRTIHSMCYRTIDQSESSVIQHKELIQLARKNGMHVSSYQDIEEGAGAKQGDKIINIESLARLKMIDIVDQWKQSNQQDCPLFLLQKWHKTLKEYKIENGLIDFTDMLEQYNTELNVDYVFIDEAQDLCPLQWKVMNKASAKAKKVFIAGDDDQSIFNWAGAIVDFFLNIHVDEETILRHSYRLPSNIYNLSRKILARIKTRKAKECSPINKVGQIISLLNFEAIKFNKEESYYILFRNKWQLKAIKKWLEKQGEIYYLFNKNVLETDEILAIQYWKDFKKTGNIEHRQYRKIQKYSSILQQYHIDKLPKKIMNKKWYTILNSIPFNTMNYLKNVSKKHLFSDIPKIKLSTIHQAKGGEADNVVLFTDISYNVWNHRFDDSEHRVWYVAVTRAKKNLYIIKEQSLQYYCI